MAGGFMTSMETGIIITTATMFAQKIRTIPLLQPPQIQTTIHPVRSTLEVSSCFT